MKRRYSFVTLSLITSGIVFCLPLNAQEKGVTLNNVWESVKSEGDKLLEYLYKHELKSPFDLIISATLSLGTFFKL